MQKINISFFKLQIKDYDSGNKKKNLNIMMNKVNYDW